MNEPITLEGILGSTMTVEAVAHTTFGPDEAVVAEVSGSAHVTGFHEFWFDPEDLLQCGFIFR
jgi:proline racemase